MLFVVSPAKNLDYESPVPTSEHSQPAMLDEAAKLAERCRELSPQELGSLMKISDKLAGLNAARFQQWSRPFTTDNARQAVFAFNGDVYTGLDATNLDNASMQYAQQHMRILSGLYGVLKPLDLMQPYRLEMGTRLKNSRGKDLYEFWGDRITESLNADLKSLSQSSLINLASNEYFKAVNTKNLNGEVITPVFKDTKNGQLKVISFYAKKARGMMARFILTEKPDSVEELKAFNSGGYYFDESRSSAKELVFCRDEQ